MDKIEGMKGKEEICLLPFKLTVTRNCVLQIFVRIREDFEFHLVKNPENFDLYLLNDKIKIGAVRFYFEISQIYYYYFETILVKV